MTVPTEPRPGHRVVDVGGVPMSALVGEVPRPRAVVVALHGGATTSVYYDAPNRPRLSLLRTGAALGFTVIALDRPGYGGSEAYADRLTDPRRRVDLAYGAVDRLLEARPRGAGVFVMAHSVGCALAVRMAADERGADLLGLEIAGTGLHRQPRADEILLARHQDLLDGLEGRGRRRPATAGAPGAAGGGLRDLIWGPRHLYPADVAGISSATPGYEGVEVEHWRQTLPDLAARIRVPVHYSLGDHETVWRCGPVGLAEVAALFTTSPRVVVHEQVNSGHNLSVGLSARAYHLKVLSFVEECALAREAAPLPSHRQGAL
ncbi:Lysophospholipase, alpha-beta hydrolase superfamily [Thermomonospora echinospora]|uniref:Lysophospholipase, alpha-beta hydrolase superfamily n=1 Tax=Thermomonospora echinospora TaxID=1992 RepID=A0A1H6DK01_9ACTN|nr:alpha/beta hydrolase [Thermomonospora echinospora]SEG84986.1 Lysophospholipase, alpha-beta hydrolase superfamily [Thermomonospora echinospora]